MKAMCNDSIEISDLQLNLLINLLLLNQSNQSTIKCEQFLSRIMNLIVNLEKQTVNPAIDLHWYI